MGRPIKKLFIGNRNVGGAGGEGVASVTVGGTNNSTGYTDGDAVTFSAPDLPNGVAATGTVLETGGQIDSIVITSAGSGYTSAPTVTAGTGTIGTTTLTAVLTTGTQNVIQCTAFITGGSNLAGDIVAQKGTTSYKVTTADGTEECTLVAATPTAAGEMQITATDSAGGTYWVTKLTNRTVHVAQNTGSQFAEGAQVKWADTAVINESVVITA